MKNKAIMIILDGYGEAKPTKFNAVTNAKSPTLKSIKQESISLLKTDGKAVGLFDGDLGGSEVGHTTIGAGRVVPTVAKQIANDIKLKKFANNKNLKNCISTLNKNGGDLHLIGLCSDKNVHSNLHHAIEIAKIAEKKVKNIFLHFITDGRDSGIFDSVKYLKQIQNKTKDIKNFAILSVSGRFFGMDRENHEERVNEAINAMFLQNSGIKSTEILKYLKNQHKNGKNDQYITPIHVENKNFCKLKKSDCLFFFNFREDRLRQLVKECKIFKCPIVTMSNVEDNKNVIYPTKPIKNTLCEYLSKHNKKVVKISESTKYAHVTYFFNGGEEKPFTNEDRIHVPSLNVDNFAKTPKMKAEEITKQVLLSMKKDYDAIIVNYSNADMVGHTGDYQSAVKAVECLDECVGNILNYAKKFGYKVLITADHGNAEEMKNKNGEPHMAHTYNRVMCACFEGNKQLKMKKFGELNCVAPTFLSLLGLPNSKYFEGENLIKTK